MGGRAQRSMYTVSGFSFINVLDSQAPLSETLAETINDFVRNVVLPLQLNQQRNVTMIFHHEGLRESNKSLFVNINSISNPGEAVLDFFERFSQSNKSFKMDEPMSFDFWISV